MSTISHARMSMPVATPATRDDAMSGLSGRLLAEMGAHAAGAGSGVGATPAGAHTGAKQNPAAVGKAFETLFASILVKQMRQTQGSNLFGHDPGDVCGGLFDHFMSQHIAQKGSLGIGKMIAKHLEHRSAAS